MPRSVTSQGTAPSSTMTLRLGGDERCDTRKQCRAQNATVTVVRSGGASAFAINLPPLTTPPRRAAILRATFGHAIVSETGSNPERGSDQDDATVCRTRRFASTWRELKPTVPPSLMAIGLGHNDNNDPAIAGPGRRRMGRSEVQPTDRRGRRSTVTYRPIHGANIRNISILANGGWRGVSRRRRLHHNRSERVENLQYGDWVVPTSLR